jgi:predicted lipoprotein with Yx(FWY)xxD motif
MRLIASVLAAVAGFSAQPAASHTGRVALKLAPSDYGQIVVDRSGRALYLFTREGSSKPRCYGACARAWPPALFSGRPRAGDGLRDHLVGTARRRNGSRQLTYAGHPLYRYVGDTGPGVVNCQAAYEFGGGWFVVGKSGEAVR